MDRSFRLTICRFVAFSPLVGIAFIAVAGLAVFLVPVLRVRVFSLIDPSYIDKSLNSGGRLFRWKYGLMNGFEHPLLGTGLGTFGGSAAQKYGYFSYTSMDSVYINVFAETGFLGIITFILWCRHHSLILLHDFSKKRNNFPIFGVALLALLIHIFVENLFNVWGITMNFWIISALSEVLMNGKDILFLSTNRYDAYFPSRKTRFAKFLSENGFRVVYVESPYTYLAYLKKEFKAGNAGKL